MYQIEVEGLIERYMHHTHTVYPFKKVILKHFIICSQFYLNLDNSLFFSQVKQVYILQIGK